MKNLLVAVWWLLVASAATAQSVTPAEDIKQLWQLIDYIAVDYSGAIENGEVISEGEYAEMLDFTDIASKQARVLSEHPSKNGLIETLDELREAVIQKADSGAVAGLANDANAVLIAAYPFPVTPTSIPDLQRGATLYSEQCAACHGVSGGGDGILAHNLDPEPIAFTDAERARMRSVMALYQVITQGVEGTSMPGFTALAEQDRWALAFFVGTLAHDDATRARGEHLWSSDAAVKNYFTDLAAVTTATEAAAAKVLPEEVARAATAYLRANPQVAETGKPSGLGLARTRLNESLAAFQAGNQTEATKLALSAYLDGFEPLEPTVAARNKSLLIAVEDTMLQYRSSLAKGARADTEAAAARLFQLFDHVDTLLGESNADSRATFIGALLILLREGVEALLIVIGIIAFLKKANQSKALAHVHAGWVTALIAGLLTWLISTYLVAISGTSREVTEGLGSLLAAAVLLSVGLWMHQKSSGDRWQAYINEKLSTALSHRSAWALFALSFVAVYREVFETILFYSALAADGNNTALLGGFLTAAGLLVIIAWMLLRTSARMPIGKFFSITSLFVAVLAVILAGKGVAGLQEAGWVGVNPVAAPRIDILGVLPTAETLSAQAIVLLIVLIGYGFNYVKGRKAKAA